MSKQRAIQNIFQSTKVMGGKVLESIGNSNVKSFTPFLRCDDYTSDGNHGFPHHPHAGMETITYCLDGAIAHEDLTGSKGILYPGDLQFMSAGRGTVHSEMPVKTPNSTGVRLLQIWVDLPKELKEGPPRYKDIREWEIPTVTEQDGKLKIKVISGSSHGVHSDEKVASTPSEMYHFILKKGAKFTQELRPNFTYFLYNMDGQGLQLNGSNKVGEHECAFFAEDEGDFITGEHVGAENDTTEFILVGGQKLDQEIVSYGPFVATSMDGIRQKFADYELAQNGFAPTRTWKSLISDGVTQDMVDGPLQGCLEKRERDRKAFIENAKAN
ncbi:hypothetical protein DICA4_D01508 [Diutina catenulata]